MRSVVDVQIGLSHSGAGGGAWAEALPGAIVEGPISVVADVRLDNEIELRHELHLPSASVETLIAAAYCAWGEGFAAKLNGDFAVVLRDARLRKIFGVRDPLGVRPLFYRAHPRSVAVAGSVRALLAREGESFPAIDDDMIVEFLVGAYAARDRTFFRDIRELPPGHLLVATADGIDVRRYWRPRIGRSSLSKEECREEFRRLFIASVERRLKATPALIHVSGGMDSSSIAGAADELVGRGVVRASDLTGVAALFPGLPCDETPFIDAVARRVRFPVERWDGTLAEPLDLIEPDIAWPGLRAVFRSGSIGDVRIANQRGARSILSGAGGDEVGGVVGIARDLLQAHRWGRAVDELLFFPGATMDSRRVRARELIGPSMPRWLRSWNSRRGHPPEWLTPAYARMAKDFPTPEAPLPLGSHVATAIWERVGAVRIQRLLTSFQEHAGPYETSFSFPFLDEALVSFVLSIPYEHWPRQSLHGRYHRRALANLLPREVQQRFGKAEFTPTIVARMRSAQPAIQAILTAGRWRSAQYVDRPKALALYRTVSSTAPASPKPWVSLWTIVTLEAWLRRIMQ